VLIFDEPVNGLDPDGIYWVRTLMRALSAEGRTVLVSSQLMSEMALTAVPKRGRVLAAKSLVFAGVTVVVGEATSFTAFFVGQALISGHAPTRYSAIPGKPGRWWERGWL
jgi:ABC-type Na+ transport system ATPase subunit NatA